MKHWYNFLCLLILTSFASYGQNVYQHFSELNGMEDYNGNTNLLYRIGSSQSNFPSSIHNNSIFLLNTSNKTDSLFQLDYLRYEYTYDSRNVLGYDFWDKDPHKFIVCGADGSGQMDLNFTLVDRFDKSNLFNQWGVVQFIGISRQDDSLVYCTYGGYGVQLFKSTTGGMTWDTVSNFGANSLSPYNDKVLFTTTDNKLIKTTDGGLTQSVVDSIPINVHRLDHLFYDKDTNYIYSSVTYFTLYPDNRVYEFSVSNHGGDANSWQTKLTSTSPIYLSIDNAVAGSVYLATGRYIYHLTDFGNNFSLIQTFDRKLVGIYQKPGSKKLYAATYTAIYEIDGSTITTIKQIPIDPEIFKFDPLDIGNKWIYKTGPTSNPDIVYKEVVKDTVLANQKTFRQIKQRLIDSLYGYVSYSYERIDSVTGDVYSWGTDSTEYIMDNLNHNQGDTIDVSRYFHNASTVFDSLRSVSLFGLPTETRVYTTGYPVTWIWAHYYLSKNIGMSFLIQEYEVALTINELKGAVIKGIVYGDTSNIVGINDKYPAHPDKFVLSQNYPNPFNPTTTINYSIPKAGNVKLTIYNVIGSKVATIVNEYKQAGNYSVQFNAGNRASGIYLYRLESGNYSAAKKFILLK